MLLQVKKCAFIMFFLSSLKRIAPMISGSQAQCQAPAHSLSLDLCRLSVTKLEEEWTTRVLINAITVH